MNTLLSKLPLELLRLLISYTTDHYTQLELEKILPVPLVRSSMKTISSLPEPCHNSFFLGLYPNLESVVPPIKIGSPTDLHLIVEHRELSQFHLVFPQEHPFTSTYSAERYYTILLDFVYRYTQKKALHANSKIKIGIGSETSLFIREKHLYISENFPTYIRTTDHPYLRLDEVMNSMRVEHLWCKSIKHPRYPHMDSMQEHICHELDRKNLFAHTGPSRVTPLVHFIGSREKLYPLLKRLSRLLQTSEFYVNVPILYSNGLHRSFRMQDFEYYEIVVTEESQVSHIPPTDKPVRLYRLPRTKPFADLSEYPVYGSVEECIHAYNRN